MKKIYISKRSFYRALLVFLLLAAGVVLFARKNQAGKARVDPLVQLEAEKETSEGAPGPVEEGVEKETETSEEESEVQDRMIAVHVSGAVLHPDQVVYLKEGARVQEAILACGGIVAEATLRRVNLAAPLYDGAKLYIPFQGEEEVEVLSKGAGGFDVGLGANQGLTNINLATKIELMTLPGIGESFAERIIAFRETNGPFETIEELMLVSGIGEKKFAELKERITVS